MMLDKVRAEPELKPSKPSDEHGPQNNPKGRAGPQ
jgi:hypothetical protein